MTQALAERPSDKIAAPVVTTDQLDLIRRTIAKDATPDELRLYLYDCERQGVHPLDKLIHFTKRAGKYTPVTSIDFMRIRAAETGEMAGSDDAVFEETINGVINSATVTVYRLTQGQRFAYTGTARWSEYKPEQNDFMWRKMPHTMLAKCAEAVALRKGFPRQLAGLYAKEELDQADNQPAALVVTPLPSPAVPSGESREKPSEPNGGELGQSIPPGFALIAEVRPGKASAKGELVMQSGESFLFFKEQLKQIAIDACQLQIPVQLTIKKSASGNRYVDGIAKLPQPITDAELDLEAARQETARPAGEVL